MAASTIKTTATKCRLCHNSLEEDLSGSLCMVCSGLNRSSTFSKMRASLQDIRACTKKINSMNKKCEQFEPIVQKYALHAKPSLNFDPIKHDVDRDALKYLEKYVPSEDNEILKNYLPVKINTSNGGSLYESIAFLCGLKVEEDTIELQVRNVIDVILNWQEYASIDSELHSYLQSDNTWKCSILEQLFEKSSVGTLLINCINAFSHVFLD
jgi:hypothetical protein